MVGSEVTQCSDGVRADEDFVGNSGMIYMGLLQGDGPTEVEIEEHQHPQQWDAAVEEAEKVEDRAAVEEAEKAEDRAAVEEAGKLENRAAVEEAGKVQDRAGSAMIDIVEAVEQEQGAVAGAELEVAFGTAYLVLPEVDQAMGNKHLAGAQAAYGQNEIEWSQEKGEYFAETMEAHQAEEEKLAAEQQQRTAVDQIAGEEQRLLFAAQNLD